MPSSLIHAGDPPRETDNRNLEEINEYLELRCEVLAARIHALELELTELRLQEP